MIFLKQLQSDSSDLLQSVRSSVNKFNSIEKTLSLNSLVSSISLKLDIFEFRYLDSKGVVISSMFEDEVGKLGVSLHNIGAEFLGAKVPLLLRLGWAARESLASAGWLMWGL